MGQQPFWKNSLSKKNKLPNAEFIDKYGLYLPNHANLSLEDIGFISKHFSKYAKPKFSI